MTHAHSRRLFLLGGASLLASACAAEKSPPAVVAAADASAATDAPLQAPGFDALADEEWAAIPDGEWRARLSPAAYGVLREEGTERPFSSPLNEEKRKGWFACAGCGLILFSSDAKFDSGTGWPSFFDAIAGRLGTKEDHKIWTVRTEYHCIRCGGHQGHVFDDGPAPTGQRWCNNGIALTFVPGA